MSAFSMFEYNTNNIYIYNGNCLYLVLKLYHKFAITITGKSNNEYTHGGIANL